MRMPDIPNPDIVITVEENDTDLFRHTEQELRNLLAKHPDKSDLLQDLHGCNDLKSLGPHPLLEGQTNNNPPTRWIHAKFQLSGSPDWVMLIIRADNVYVKGFANERDRTCFCYEITEPAQQGDLAVQHLQILPPEYLAIPLQWDVKYKKLLDCQDEEVEERLMEMYKDPTFIADTIRYLSSYDNTVSDENKAEVRRRLAGLIFRFCEYARMKLRDRSKHIIEKVQRWSQVCAKLRFWRDSGYKTWRGEQFKKMGIHCPKDALEYVCLILNSSQQSLDDMERRKVSKISSKGGKGAPSKSDPDGQGGDGAQPTKEDDRTAQGFTVLFLLWLNIVSSS
ncbi:hypothetical protein C2845_PM15G21040 [Panicum miliaceum]|uniref:rRNA N-glycosylase n=1 Tax=Panicum miliaceum TaxID=4540 RepID=A0A3L6Q9V5_PANMI|nr:hypothetical protein C2845_PM15G21040 [Panicum miliaceum]